MSCSWEIAYTSKEYGSSYEFRPHFITNEENKNLQERFRALFKNTRFIDDLIKA
jgi:hypothetical protein